MVQRPIGVLLMVATRHHCRIATNKRLRIAQKQRFVSFSIHLSKIEINELLGLFPGQQRAHLLFGVQVKVFNPGKSFWDFQKSGMKIAG